MSIGIVNDDSLQEELDNLSDSSFPKSAEIKDIKSGRGENPNVPDELRKIIGDDGVTHGRESARKLAGQFGLSQQSADAYMKGATSLATYNEPSSLTEHIESSKEKVSKKARKTLMKALGHITGEKLAYAKVRDLAGIAKDMSGIIKNMEPSSQQAEGSNVQFVFYTPPMKKESSYEVIDAPE